MLWTPDAQAEADAYEQTNNLIASLASDAMWMQAELARRSLYEFVKYTWSILQPGIPFVDNWHIHAICEHLEAVHRGEISKLIINIAPRQNKSTIVSTMFPAWEWLDKPWLEYLTWSYAMDLSMRDAVNSRTLMNSPRYRMAMLMGDPGLHFRMAGDQDVKTRYQNTQRGQRTVTATDAKATGYGGNRLIGDDPVSAKQADSETHIKASVEFYKGTMSTRRNNPKTDAIVLTHQRLSPKDLTGYLLENEPGQWTVLKVAMRHDPQIISLYPGAWKPTITDPRTVKGELLHEDRLDETVVRQMEHDLGPYHTDAQLQQNPSPRAGIIFKRANWRYYRQLPPLDKLSIVLSLDSTFKQLETSDYVSLTVWAAETGTYNRYLLDRVYGKMGISGTINSLIVMGQKWYMYIAALIEDTANGPAIIELMHDKIRAVTPITPQGGKVSRAYSVEPSHVAGELYLPDPSYFLVPWLDEYLGNMSRFPDTPDDDADSTTQALNWYRTRENAPLAIVKPLTGGERTH